MTRNYFCLHTCFNLVLYKYLFINVDKEYNVLNYGNSSESLLAISGFLQLYISIIIFLSTFVKVCNHINKTVAKSLWFYTQYEILLSAKANIQDIYEVNKVNCLLNNPTAEFMCNKFWKVQEQLIYTLHCKHILWYIAMPKDKFCDIHRLELFILVLKPFKLCLDLLTQYLISTYF